MYLHVEKNAGMELTVSIKDQEKVAIFLNLLKNIDYVELIEVSEDRKDFMPEHVDILTKRLQKIEKGQVGFKSWDLIKAKYEINTSEH